jgi:tRNA A37 threonylcarbamoyladenosine dehydratase
MGAGNKLDPTAFVVTDLSKTTGDGLARVMRRELKKRGIRHQKVIYSRELPQKPLSEPEPEPGSTRRSTPGSVAFVPPVAGLIAAGEVIKDLAGSLGKTENTIL